MKKQITSLLIISILSIAPTAIAENITTSEVKAPVWEEYVPQKYQNPRQFPNRGKNIAELSVGIVLTDLLITAPIGISPSSYAFSPSFIASYIKLIKFSPNKKVILKGSFMLPFFKCKF